MNVLIACEYSGIVRDAFRNAGHNAWSCDLIPTEGDPAYHYQMDIKELLRYTEEDWDLMIAHPTCTFLSNSGVRHLHENVTSKNGVRAKINGKERWKEMGHAAEFFNFLHNSKIHRIAIENPVPHKYAKALIGNYTQLIRPWQFGEKKTKAVCLWLKNLPKLKPTNIVGPPPKNMTQEEKRSWHECHYTAPSKDRGKIRSRFFKGVAEAMATQWSNI